MLVSSTPHDKRLAVGSNRPPLIRFAAIWRATHEHLDDAAHLAAGRTIGSGMVEGACKNVIGRRLKQTGARWRIRRANRMATLATTLYSDEWDHCWNSAA